ncbi:MAG TPA: hypothetical protein VGU61_22400 [Noviherbaspirillum sp.]|jgi:hypothetical protein|uniref:hypothetical protein n=1 Tax=Noviherbaspirillum sp. TaxID=1926288 RepID=UPI002DDD9D96|nr:hypothetical protein [Noviherbaspirillum sp.]HEV2613028.1 hypothetical protein [Noviherbaspirillum sp.]
MHGPYACSGEFACLLHGLTDKGAFLEAMKKFNPVHGKEFPNAYSLNETSNSIEAGKEKGISGLVDEVVQLIQLEKNPIR